MLTYMLVLDGWAISVSINSKTFEILNGCLIKKFVQKYVLRWYELAFYCCTILDNFVNLFLIKHDLFGSKMIYMHNEYHK